MATKHLQRNPHYTSDPDVWWYEEPAGIWLVRSDHHPQVLIRWPLIRAALRRKDQRKHDRT